jgi:RHS repeat-associated protein
MQPALSTPFAQPPIPAWGELSEKPRLGFTSKNAAWNPGPNVCNSTAAIGMRAGLALNRVRSRCSAEQYDSDLGLYYLRARYYNPLTGRFLSRDPNNPEPVDEDGVPTDPKALHKYLYAHGDPVNRTDPSGRDDLVATVEIDFGAAIRSALAATAVAAGVVCILNTAADLVVGVATDVAAPIQSITFGFCSAKVRRGCSCTAKCTCHVNGMPDHGNTGIYVTGSGTANSCPAARTLAKQDAGMSCNVGEHAQHCSYQCDGK